ncbi:uncharacterized protein PAC_03883 [Phialocephala subalpina]|uniref:Uncharacterized protein n=1 Tax=Phialocephala subalpina TaxID=576137 RepID=A0A1L7WML6_9HELO|nr:uncharacterized protein PAC_03883 [Phialocephala subalpina]
MISLRTVRLLPLLVTLLDTIDETPVGNVVNDGANTFCLSPAAKISTTPITFAQVQHMQEVYSIRRAHILESVGKIELYEKWSIGIIAMMQFFGTRQKCQNCGHGHKSDSTAMQWIKWHGTLLSLKVEMLSETSFNLLVFMARTIESHYHKDARGSPCRKHKVVKLEKSRDVSAEKAEGNANGGEGTRVPND